MAIVIGTSGNDSLVGSANDDLILGLAGNDTVAANAGADFVVAGTGDDSVRGNAGNDRLHGGLGNDTLFGGADNDLILGDSSALISSDFEGSDGVQLRGDSVAVHYDTTFDGWTSDDPAVEVRLAEGYDGSQAVEINVDPDGSGFPDAINIYQDVATTAGESYTLTFLYAPRPGFNASITSFDVEIDGVVVGSFAEDGSGDSSPNYQSYSVTFDATTDTTRVEFISTGTPTSGGRGAYLDEIYLVSNEGSGEGGDADSIDAGDGSDTVYGQGGGDTILAGIGDDVVYGGLGNDLIRGDSGESDSGAAAVPGAGSGLVGEIFSDGGSFVDVNEAIALTESSSPVYTFSSTALDYPNGGTTSHSDDIGAFLGSDSSSLSPGSGASVTNENLAFKFSGYIYIPAGTYDFTVGSDDGFRLLIGGNTITEFTGPRGFATTTGSETFTGGIYEFELFFFENGGAEGVEVTSTLTGGSILDSSILYTDLDDVGLELTFVDTGGGTGYYEISEDQGGEDKLHGGEGNDTLEGDGGNDTLRGGQDNDLLQGEGGDDLAAGEFGDDTVQGGIGDDLLYGDRQNGSASDPAELPVAPDVFQYRAQDTNGNGDLGDNPSNGSSINPWNDASGNGANASASGTAPVLDNTSVNNTPGVDFSATTGYVTPPNSAAMNTASTYSEKSFAFAFQTGSDVSGTQMIFEQGGGTRGYNLVIAEDPSNGNQPTLYAMVWNTAEWSSGNNYKTLNLGVVSADSTYTVVLVHDATSAVSVEQTWTGYLDGSQVDQLTDVDTQRAHSGGAGLGDLNGGSRLPDQSNANTAGDISFDGSISEAISWNTALDSGQVAQTFTYLDEQVDLTPPGEIGVDGNDSLSGGDGNDTLYGQGEDDTLGGGADDDKLYGGTGDDVLGGGADDDTLYGGENNDSLAGGANADKLYSGAGTDKLEGDAGNDTLYGEAGENSLYGGDDNDLLIDTIGGADQIHLFGDAGDDTLQGVVNVNNYTAMAGGAGNDIITLSQLSGSSVAEIFGDDTFGATYSENPTDGNDKITASGDGKIIVHGQRGDDTLIGGEGEQALYGGSGDDSLTGGNDSDTLMGYLGNDTLSGGAGNDIINGSLGADSQMGGSGDDTIYWDSKDVAISGGSGNNDLLLAWAGNDTIILDDAILGGGAEANGGFERIDLKEGDDFIIGDRVFAGDTSLHLIAGDGKDTISLWGDGDDTIEAGDGVDWIYGGDGGDQIYGGLEGDFLYAGAGNDTIYGGSGDDNYYFGRGDDVDFIVDGDGDDGLAFFHGYNDTLGDGVQPGEVLANYDNINEIVTLTVVDGDDPDGDTDGSVSFAFGDIDFVEVRWGVDFVSYAWDEASNTFVGL
ncbi:calcium-binding protein [Rhodovibrionaceae bacterium A322]